MDTNIVNALNNKTDIFHIGCWEVEDGTQMIEVCYLNSGGDLHLDWVGHGMTKLEVEETCNKWTEYPSYCTPDGSWQKDTDHGTFYLEVSKYLPNQEKSV